MPLRFQGNGSLLFILNLGFYILFLATCPLRSTLFQRSLTKLRIVRSSIAPVTSFKSYTQSQDMEGEWCIFETKMESGERQFTIGDS